METKELLKFRIKEMQTEIETATPQRLIEICLVCIETTEEIIQRLLKLRNVVPKQRTDFEQRLIKLQRIKPIIIIETNETKLKEYANASIGMIETISGEMK